jgi:hypothetical protein
MANRRQLLKAIASVQAGGLPPQPWALQQAGTAAGPDTMDCIAPAAGWQAHWQALAAAKRAAAPWLAAVAARPGAAA